MQDNFFKFFKGLIFGVVIISFAIPVSVVFENIFDGTVYAAKKERRKPPKARRTQTMTKKVGAEFIKAQEALGEDLVDRALSILENLLRREELRDFEKAQITRLQAYVWAEKDDYPKAMIYLQRAFSYNALQPQDQLDLQYQIAQLHLALDKWKEGEVLLTQWFEDAEALGSPPGPSAHALLAQIYLYFASDEKKDSP